MLGFIERDDFHQAEVFTQFCDDDNDRQMVRERDKIASRLVEQLLSKHSDGLRIAIPAPRIACFRNHSAIGDAFHVEKQVLQFVLGGRHLRIGARREVSRSGIRF